MIKLNINWWNVTVKEIFFEISENELEELKEDLQECNLNNFYAGNRYYFSSASSIAQYDFEVSKKSENNITFVQVRL